MNLNSIIGVGGDGTINEIVNALLARTQNEAGLDVDDPEVTLVRPKLKVGIIPAGEIKIYIFSPFTACKVILKWT